MILQEKETRAGKEVTTRYKFLNKNLQPTLLSIFSSSIIYYTGARGAAHFCPCHAGGAAPSASNAHEVNEDNIGVYIYNNAEYKHMVISALIYNIIYPSKGLQSVIKTIIPLKHHHTP